MSDLSEEYMEPVLYVYEPPSVQNDCSNNVYHDHDFPKDSSPYEDIPELDDEIESLSDEDLFNDFSDGGSQDHDQHYVYIGVEINGNNNRGQLPLPGDMAPPLGQQLCFNCLDPLVDNICTRCRDINVPNADGEQSPPPPNAPPCPCAPPLDQPPDCAYCTRPLHCNICTYCDNWYSRPLIYCDNYWFQSRPVVIPTMQPVYYEYNTMALPYYYHPFGNPGYYQPMPSGFHNYYQPRYLGYQGNLPCYQPMYWEYREFPCYYEPIYVEYQGNPAYFQPRYMGYEQFPVYNQEAYQLGNMEYGCPMFFQASYLGYEGYPFYLQAPYQPCTNEQECGDSDSNAYDSPMSSRSDLSEPAMTDRADSCESLVPPGVDSPSYARNLPTPDRAVSCDAIESIEADFNNLPLSDRPADMNYSLPNTPHLQTQSLPSSALSFY